MQKVDSKIIFFVRYPTKADLKDGYFQRVRSVDDVFDKEQRIYVDYVPQWTFLSKEVFVKKGVFNLEISTKNPFQLLFLVLLVIYSGRVYFHSILRLRSPFHRLLYFLARKRILDLHGAVPEECELYGEKKKSKIFSYIERFAVRRADIIISVSDALSSHIRKKYSVNKNKFVSMPIFSGVLMKVGDKRYVKNIIYCGGLQMWQQVEKMLEYVFLHKNEYDFTFLVSNPEVLKKKYFDLYKENFPGIVCSASSDEVQEHYAKNCFGLILREDIAVNRVSCPTKMMEYLQYGIIPIVDSPEVGDFRRLGYKYVLYKENLPQELVWQSMIADNKKAVRLLREHFEKGREKLLTLL